MNDCTQTQKRYILAAAAAAAGAPICRPARLDKSLIGKLLATEFAIIAARARLTRRLDACDNCTLAVSRTMIWRRAHDRDANLQVLVCEKTVSEWWCIGAKKIVQCRRRRRRCLRLRQSVADNFQQVPARRRAPLAAQSLLRHNPFELLLLLRANMRCFVCR